MAQPSTRPFLLVKSVVVFLVWMASTAIAHSQSLTVERRIPLGEVAGRIDHLAFDATGSRVFIAELGNNTVSAVDLKSGAVVHRITGLHEPQGIAYLPAQDLIVVANAKTGDVLAYRGSDYSVAWRVLLGDDADNVRLDSNTGEIFVGYGRALAVLDAAGKKVRNIPLEGHPEGFQLTASRIFVNVPTARSIAMVDRASGHVTNWQTDGAAANFPMALDPSGRSLLVVFRNPARLMEFDAQTGAVLASSTTCGDADDLWADGKRGRIYVSCGEGKVAIFRLDGSALKEVDGVMTAAGARTSLFVPDADQLLVAAPARGADKATLWVLRPSEKTSQ